MAESNDVKWGGTGESYFEEIPSTAGTSASNKYTVQCGFKAKRIVAVSAHSVSSVLCSGLAYDYDTNPSQYYCMANTLNGWYDIGTNGSGSRGLILDAINDNNFVIYGAHSGRSIFVLATSE